MVLNLVVNALRSIPEGQPDRYTVSIELRFREGSVVLRVRHDGPAIAAAALPHLFDPFALQGADLDGTDLGLAVTHQLVNRHRGRIDVESGEEGTCFEVELPPAVQGEDAAEEAVA